MNLCTVYVVHYLSVVAEQECTVNVKKKKNSYINIFNSFNADKVVTFLY